MYKAYDDVNGDASRWLSGIRLSENLSNPFSNIVIRDKWDKAYNSIKWVPGLLFTGYTFLIKRSDDAKMLSLAATVSITGLIDIIQNLRKRDAENSTINMIKEGAISIDAIAFYRAGYNDIQEIKTLLVNFQNFMVKEDSEYNAWYKEMERPYFTDPPSSFRNTDFWSNKVFEEAIGHFSNIDKKMDAFSEIFEKQQWGQISTLDISSVNV